MKKLSRLFLLVIYTIFIIEDVISSEAPILLILLYDGFRNDYLDRGISPTLTNFRDNGVHSDFLKTVHQAVAYPALHSIATGLYPDHHGITGRKVIKADGTTAGHGEKATSDLYALNDTVPIWALNRKNKGESICMMWPGADETYKGYEKCDYNTPYKNTKTLRKRADEMIDCLKEKPKVNLVMFYVEQLDKVTHFFGPLSRNSSLMIKKLDLLTKYIISKLIDIEAYHRTNIFIISDHGMIGTETGREKSSEKDIFGFPGASEKIKKGPNKQYTFKYDYASQKADYETKVTEYITKLNTNIATHPIRIIRIPRSYNFTNGILEVECLPNYYFEVAKWQGSLNLLIYNNIPALQQPQAPSLKVFGMHGYLRQNDALFMAKGPLLATFKKVEPFEMVDFYGAFAKILNIKGDFENDGNFSRILPIFQDHRSVHWPIILCWIFALAVIFTFGFAILVSFLLNTHTRHLGGAEHSKINSDVYLQKRAKRRSKIHRKGKTHKRKTLKRKTRRPNRD